MQTLSGLSPFGLAECGRSLWVGATRLGSLVWAADLARCAGIGVLRLHVP
jgi:hypothetical protein